MKGLESGKDKIQKICDALRKETLDPAKQEAGEILENAHLRGQEIIQEAEIQAKRCLANADQEIEERKKLCHASLQLSCRQAVELLKQKIEEELFDRRLADYIAKEMSDPKMIAHLINSMIHAIEQKGIDEEFTALIPKEISCSAINALLAAQTLAKLEHNSVAIGDFRGGAQIRLKGRQMTLDISDSVLCDLIGQYIRSDFRKLIFKM